MWAVPLLLKICEKESKISDNDCDSDLTVVKGELVVKKQTQGSVAVTKQGKKLRLKWFHRALSDALWQVATPPPIFESFIYLLLGALALGMLWTGQWTSEWVSEWLIDWMSEWVRDVWLYMSYQSDWIYYKQPIKFLVLLQIHVTWYFYLLVSNGNLKLLVLFFS